MSNNKMKGLLKGLRYISQIFGMLNHTYPTTTLFSFYNKTKTKIKIKLKI